MDTEVLIKFFNENEPEKVDAYIQRLIDNIKDVSSLVSRYYVYLLMIIFAYYLTKESQLESINLGIIQISDLKIIKILLPPVFTFIYLVLLVAENRRQTLSHQVKVLFNMRNKTELNQDDLQRTHFNEFNSSFLPFNFITELTHKVSYSKISGVLIMFMLLCLIMFLSSAFFVFEYFMLKDLYSLWYDGMLEKVIFILTVCMFVLSLYFALRFAFINFTAEKRDKEFWTLVSKE
ncbi:MAG: hypothetical protein PHC38_07565 [Weeksellaceae bacterium]|nr:hypothetical protein [Weeksellaceae bacterium]